MSSLLAVVALTLLISAFCSLLEAILYSSRVGTLEAASRHGQHQEAAQQLLQMKRDISAPIAAILIVNTVANTAGATLSGMYAAQVFALYFVPIFSLGLTVAILLLSEILPKTLGVVYWSQLWPMIVRPLAILQVVLAPLISGTEQFAKLFIRHRSGPTVTEDEILAMARLGATVGEISHQESAMVHSIIQLEEKPVGAICTPRLVMFTLDANTTVADALTAVRAKPFSRIPIYETQPENITGYVTVRDLLLADTPQTRLSSLRTLAKPMRFLPDTADCLQVLNSFFKQRRQIAMIIDEHGGLAGLITLEDLIETALGTEIVDETDQVVDLRGNAQRLGRQAARTGN